MKSLSVLCAWGILVAGCSSPSSSNARDHSWNADYSKWGEDPVAGHLILKRTAVQRVYEGRSYYFTDEAEATMFDSSPEAYLKPSELKSVNSGGDVVHTPSGHSR